MFSATRDSPLQNQTQLRGPVQGTVSDRRVMMDVAVRWPIRRCVKDFTASRSGVIQKSGPEAASKS
jgi:hypothetical protein